MSPRSASAKSVVSSSGRDPRCSLCARSITSVGCFCVIFGASRRCVGVDEPDSATAARLPHPNRLIRRELAFIRGVRGGHRDRGGGKIRRARGRGGVCGGGG